MDDTKLRGRNMGERRKIRYRKIKGKIYKIDVRNRKGNSKVYGERRSTKGKVEV